jgi:hypothetical protein
MSDRSLSADDLMGRLIKEGERAADSRRIATLSRLVEACDDLLSGQAYKLAKSAKRNPEFFNPNFFRLNSNAVHQYVRLRAHLDGSRTSWTGPVATTIRADRDLMAYLKMRESEVNRPATRKLRGSRSGKLEDVVNGLQSITDQAIVRQALADGRAWKRELDILLATLRLVPSIDVDALREGKTMSASEPAGTVSNAISSEESRTLKKLLIRLRDDDQLGEFGLRCRNGRVKMASGPGLDLVFPEEMALLARLAGEERSSGST